MKKEDWINSILQSAAEIKEVEVNPFLFNKIENQLNQIGKKTSPLMKHNLGWAITISIVIALNLATLVVYKSKIHKQNETAAIETLSNEMISTTTYNY